MVELNCVYSSPMGQERLPISLNVYRKIQTKFDFRNRNIYLVIFLIKRTRYQNPKNNKGPTMSVRESIISLSLNRWECVLPVKDGTLPWHTSWRG